MKQPIILLHGWGSNPERWKDVINLLKDQGYKVYTPYLPGFDPKDKLTKPYTIQDYSLWLKDYINKLKYPEVILIGHSHGGRVIANYMNKYAQKVSKTIVIAGAGIPNKLPFYKKIVKNISSFSSNKLRKIIPSSMYNFLQQILYKSIRETDYLNSDNIMKRTMNNMLKHDSTSDYSSIKVPTLLLWGDKDTYTPLDMGKEISKIIPKSELIIIENGKHGLHLTHPKEIVNYVINFLDKNN